jgi:hypothetical protein
MDFSDLTLEELIEAIKRTPNIAVLARLREEFRRFPSYYDMLEELYQRERSKWNAFSSRLRANFGKCLLYWTNDNIPFLQCEYSLPIKSFPPGISDKIEWIKNALKDRPLSDIINDTKWDALFNAMYSPIASEQEEAEERRQSGIIDGKLYKSIKDTIIVNPSELDEILKKDEEELIREREIDEKLRKKEKIPEQEVKKIAEDAKETVKAIKKVRKKKPIPPEVRDLYDMYIGIKPNYPNLYKFMLWLERVMRTFPNYEYQELLDRADLANVREAIRKGEIPDEYYDEAYNDLVKRLHGKEEGGSFGDIERIDAMNRALEVFSRLLDLLFRIYSEYKREQDEGAARGILRILCENFDICYESTIEEVRKDIQGWVMDHIDFLPL